MMSYGDETIVSYNANVYDLSKPDVKGRTGNKKFIPQAVPGINNVRPGQGAEWERKQRAKEYRVAARREKRNRKADEKKQRKLNATILRRMTRNPEKYNKNADRNRLRAIQLERQAIWAAAVKQAELLAVDHDPSGKMFNVSPVKQLEDGTIISEEALKRRDEARAKRAAEKAEREEAAKKNEAVMEDVQPDGLPTPASTPNGVNPERYLQMEAAKNQRPRGISKTQQRKLDALKPKPPPPKPVIPDHIVLPDGEENFVALWDLSDSDIERRVNREKRRKANARKELRQKQKTGKMERRMARDERRKVYREMKDMWRNIKAEQAREKIRITALEEEERKKIAVEINEWERQQAMEACASLAFTLENTEGVAEIQPSVKGMKGVEIDFDDIEPDPENRANIKLKDPSKFAKKMANPKRVDLGGISGNARSLIPAGRSNNNNGENANPEAEDFVKLDIGADDHQHVELTFNHQTRRKLRRCIDNAILRREILVREKCVSHLQETDQPIPDILKTPYKSTSTKGARILENGTLETAKQERVRQRLELTEFNKVMKVLRRQAKETATEAGLRKYAEETGRIPKPQRDGEDKAEKRYQEIQYNNGPARIPGDNYGLGSDEDVEMMDVDGNVEQDNDDDMSDTSTDSDL